MVTFRPVYFPWGAILLVILALSAVAWLEHSTAATLRQRLSAAEAAGQRDGMQRAGAVVSKDAPDPPVPLPLRNQVDAVRRAVPEAKPERAEDVRTVWIEAQGPVLPCDQSPPHAAAGSPDASPGQRAGGATSPGLSSAPDGAGGALLRVGDRFRIRLVSVDLSTPQGATGTVGEGELLRFDGASLGRGPLDQDGSTVWRLQRPQERPPWWVMLAAGLTEQVRPWALAAGGKGHWGGALGVDRIVFPDRSEKWNRKVGAAWTARW